MKNTLKNVYYKILKFKRRLLYGRPVLVLMYHRVSDVAANQLEHLTVSVENFESQLLYYKKKYQIFKLDEEWTFLKKTGIVITFDDGYADNILNALPLLEKYQIPATIFVSTLNINTKKEFWWDRLVLDYASCDDVFFLPDLKTENSKSSSTYKYIVNQIAKLSNDEKEKWFLEFEKLNQLSFSPREEYRSLTKKELKSLSEHPLISIGIHTHNHYSLGNLTYEEQKTEILLSIEKLNELTDKNIKYLALPHGSYNLETIKIMNELDLSGILFANNYYSSMNNKTGKKINRILIPNIRNSELVTYLNKFDFKIW